jgi:hypothetical protein
MQVIKNPKGWEVGVASFAFTPEARAALGAPSVPLPAPFTLLYSHQDAVIEAPPG